MNFLDVFRDVSTLKSGEKTFYKYTQMFILFIYWNVILSFTGGIFTFVKVLWFEILTIAFDRLPVYRYGHNQQWECSLIQFQSDGVPGISAQNHQGVT